MYKYFIFINDYKNNKICKLYDGIHYSKYDGLEIIQKLAETYIKDIIGEKKIKYYNEFDKNRDYNYFIMKPLNDNHKLIVAHKYIKTGYLYNSVHIEKIISFNLLEFKQEPNKRDVNNNDFNYIDEYNEVLNELINKDIFIKEELK